MAILLLISFFLSLTLALHFIRTRANSTDSYSLDKPQRFHAGNISRLGGLAIGISTVLTWMLATQLQTLEIAIETGLSVVTACILILILLPAWLTALYEDHSHRLTPLSRLIATSCSALLSCLLLDIYVPPISVPYIEFLWSHNGMIGYFLAFLAVSGFPHAMNIIDGYNGLASIVAIMICTALIYVAMQFGDRMLITLLVCVVGATLGFIVWNFPKGMIFAGDSGSYLWGIAISVISILLIQRHSAISPWFVLLLLIYPIWETVFSIYRKLARGQSPSMADSMHFHQLVYKRIVRGVFHDNKTRQMLMRNNRTSPYLWAFCALSVAPAALFWYSTPILMFFCALFIVTYVSAYLMIVRFKVPRWLRLLGRGATKKPPT
jgi:UDP-GlcNAc:undecaprenyl-phosphate/decaprenyl-phosphate GlcNAc-1-phosphate transferase